MTAVLTLLTVIGLSLLITRIATVSLVSTGLSKEAARFQVVTSARMVGSEQLQYFGNSRTQYTVSLTSRIIDLSTGRAVVGPETETIKYTSLNMEQNLSQGVETMARRMAQALRRQIQVP